MAEHVSRQLGARAGMRLPWPTGPRLVVVPTVEFGVLADKMGMIDDDERWTIVEGLDRIRGLRFVSWRYLDTLDTPPPHGASTDVVEAWLQRPHEGPFPPLDPGLRVQLDAMVMFAAP